MSKLTEVAKNRTNTVHLYTDRERVKIPDLMRIFPDGVHINDFERSKGKRGDDYFLVTFEEDPNGYFYSNVVLYDILEAWENIEDCHKLLKREPVHIKFRDAESKNGTHYVMIDVLED